MRKVGICVGSILSGILLLMSTGYAADMKIGVVDFQTVLQKSSAVKAAAQNMRKEFAPKQAAITKKEKQLQTLQADLKKNAPVMKAADRSKLEGQVSDLQAELSKDMQEYQKEVFSDQQETMQKILANVNEVVEKIAKKQNFDFIFASNTVPYYKSTYNITDQVVAEMK